MTERWDPPIGWNGPSPVLYQPFDSPNGFTLNTEAQHTSLGDIQRSEMVKFLYPKMLKNAPKTNLFGLNFKVAPANSIHLSWSIKEHPGVEGLILFVNGNFPLGWVLIKFEIKWCKIANKLWKREWTY